MASLIRKEFLGEGSFGSVYKVELKGKTYALKNYDSLVDLIDKGQLESTLVEINALLSLDHPNIIKGYDIYLDDSRLGILLELADTDLNNFLSNFSLDGTPEPADIKSETKVRYLYELLSGLGFLHRNGFIHCDIKPGNILIKNGSLLLADLSLLRRGLDSLNICQTYDYRSPDLLIRDYIYGQNDLRNLSGNNFVIRDLADAIDESDTSKLEPRFQKLLEEVERSGEVDINLHSDIYALGLVFLNIILGTSNVFTLFSLDPDAGYTAFSYFITEISVNEPEVIAAKLSLLPNWPTDLPGLEKIISRMITAYPNLRYRTVDEIFADNFFSRRGYTSLTSGNYSKILPDKVPVIYQVVIENLLDTSTTFGEFVLSLGYVSYLHKFKLVSLELAAFLTQLHLEELVDTVPRDKLREYLQATGGRIFIDNLFDSLAYLEDVTALLVYMLNPKLKMGVNEYIVEARRDRLFDDSVLTKFYGSNRRKNFEIDLLPSYFLENLYMSM